MDSMTSIIKLLRPHQWIKNTFVFLPLFFNGKIVNTDLLFDTIIIFFCFSLAASGIYCFNDIYDADSDMLHPLKKYRPIASGAISKSFGYVLMAICILVSISIVFLYPWQSSVNVFNLFAIIVFYILMNIAYCIKLKQIAIVDVFIIAVGFVLRIFIGGIVTGIYISQWLVLMTFLLALFLAFAKRRDDVVMYEDSRVKARKNINRYNLSFMNQTISIVASVTMVCYIMYTVSPEVEERFNNSNVYLTVVFVLAGIIRYIQLTIVDVKSGSPTKVLLHDRFIQL